MAEIKISIDALDAAIGRLNALKAECEGYDTSYPAIVGGGKTVNELEAMAELYRRLNTDLATLLSNTAAFMTNIRNSFVDSDAKAAAGIRGGGN